jgi:2-C-methyl-D-erythritol 4-phosphate cytidylyltransferase
VEHYAVIVAGGSGNRMGSEIPKQFLKLAGKPVLMHTLQAFYEAVEGISLILVLPLNHIPFWEELCNNFKFEIPHLCVPGGETRGHSVKNGLSKIMAEQALVAIHDGVRPLADKTMISGCFSLAFEKGSAVPCIPLSDSLRKKDNHGSHPVDRNEIYAVQTPQCFEIEILRTAYARADFMNYTDDAQLAEAAGFQIHLAEGSRRNLKITTPEDLILAEALIKAGKLSVE